MHALLATLGTDGDVFPHLGLGAVLRARGHRVTLAAPEPYRRRAQELGLEFCPLVTAEAVGRMLADPDLWHPLKSGPMMARWGAHQIGRQFDLLAPLAREAGTVLVANPGVLAARVVQEKFGVPTATLLLQPGLLPSSAAPPEMVAGLTIPPWLPHWARGLYWRAVDAAGGLLLGGHLNAVRRSVGLPPVRRLFRWWLSPELVIGLFPPWFAEPQPDWPAQLRLAGFDRFDGARGGLPAEVEDFCRSGPPPVAFTLGTGMAHAGRFFRTAAVACERAGVRGLLLTKYAEVVPRRLPAGVRHCAFAPFRQLLPLCGAVVHHGGVGTTAAAVAAACPQVVLPMAWDQPDNAVRVVRLGVGVALGSRRRTAGHLARALGRVTAPDVLARCREVAARAGSGDGLEVAAGWVENLAGRS